MLKSESNFMIVTKILSNNLYGKTVISVLNSVKNLNHFNYVV